MTDYSFSSKGHDTSTDGGTTNLLNFVSDTKVFSRKPWQRPKANGIIMKQIDVTRYVWSVQRLSPVDKEFDDITEVYCILYKLM